MQQEKQIFLSYSRVDTKFAKKLAGDLRSQNFDVWMDQSHIAGGKHWDNDIEKALKNASSVVLVVSPTSVKSENVKDEIAFAKHRNIQIIPVVYKEAETPLGWDRLQWIEMQKSYDKGLNELIDSIQGNSYHDKKAVPIKKPKSLSKIFIYIGLMLGLMILSYIYLSQRKINPPISHIQSSVLMKHNTIVIGNGNSDINITQE